MANWSYLVFTSGPNRDHELHLGQLGIMGWELVSVAVGSAGDHFYFFKRPIDDAEAEEISKTLIERAAAIEASDAAEKAEYDRVLALQKADADARETKVAKERIRREAAILASQASPEEA